MAPNVKPSGQQFEIAHGDRRAVVTEVGATLREYSVGPERILDGFSEDDICSGGRGQLLAPWPNRIRDGFFEFAGENNQLPINEVARHNAIHGLVRWLPWRPLEQKAHLVRLADSRRPCERSQGRFAFRASPPGLSAGANTLDGTAPHQSRQGRPH